MGGHWHDVGTQRNVAPHSHAGNHTNACIDFYTINDVHANSAPHRHLNFDGNPVNSYSVIASGDVHTDGRTSWALNSRAISISVFAESTT